MSSAITNAFAGFQYTTMLKDAENRILQQQEAMAIPYDTEVEVLTSRGTDLSKLASRMRQAETAIDTGLTAIGKIRDKVSMLQAYLSGYAASTDKQYIREQINTLISEVQGEADSLPSYRNLVGDVDPVLQLPNKVDYKTLDGLTKEVEGTDLGASFTITANNGTIWVGDSRSQTMTQYSSYPSDPTGKSTSLINGLSLQSVVGDQITVDRVSGAGTEETIEGTITRNGLGLMGTWFYKELATDEDIAQLTADLQEASFRLIYEESLLISAKTTLSGNQYKLEQEKVDIADDVAAIIDKKATALAEHQIQSELVFGQVIDNLNASAKESYASALLKSALQPSFKIFT